MFSDLVTNLDVVVKLKAGTNFKDHNFLYNDIKSKLSHLNDANDKIVKEFCAKYCYNTNKKWENANRKEQTFRSKYSEWLESEVVWPQFMKDLVKKNVEPVPSTSTQFDDTSPEKVSVGTSTHVSPRKPFTELGPKQKKRRTEHTVHTIPSEEFSHAHVLKLKAGGNEDIADILQHLLKNPQDVQKVIDCLFVDKKRSKFSPDEALGLFLSLKLSKWQYNTLRKSTEEVTSTNIFPSYYAVQNEKTKCYPPKTAISVTEKTAKIELQALLDITVKRIIMSNAIDGTYKNMTLISKWGFDGASNQANYKQKHLIESAEDDDFDDSSVFMGSLIPIKLVSEDQLVWENDSPNSALWCRPLFFKFIKENKFSIIQEKNAIEAEIGNLEETVVGEMTISHNLILTMIDGKVTAVLCDTSTQRCDICKSTPKEMNDLPLILTKEVDADLYRYGLSSLHIWIRFMECILHIAYRLDLKTWVVKGDSKTIMETRKKNIQEAFKSQTGLLVDVVKQGHGTTNDGNTARRFFEHSDIAASITGVNEELIKRFKTILEAISSGHRIDTLKFKDYTEATMKLYVDLYNWFYMPASVHKVLAHGAAIIENLGIVPIGKLSEEAAEARNKDFRRYREHHSRKFCRKATNEDILNNLLISSDPHISKIRHKLVRKHKSLSEEAKSLLILRETFVDDDDQENIGFLTEDPLLMQERESEFSD